MKNKKTCCTARLKEDDLKAHWDTTFRNNTEQNWSEKTTPFAIKWIQNLGLKKDISILCAGVGDSILVDELLKQGFTNITVNDISTEALNKIKTRVKSENVTYLEGDILTENTVSHLVGTVDLYIDRATLHFFTKCRDKDQYFSQLTNILSKNGIIIIGVFSKDNEPKCCGLDLQLWSLESLKNRLHRFDIIKTDSHSFKERNSRIRNYIYLLAQREE